MPTRTPPKRPSRAEIGLKRWLDDTSADHNGKGYADFVRMVGDDPDNPLVSPTRMMKEMNYKSTHSIYQLLALHKREQNK